MGKIKRRAVSLESKARGERIVLEKVRKVSARKTQRRGEGTISERERERAGRPYVDDLDELFIYCTMDGRAFVARGAQCKL